MKAANGNPKGVALIIGDNNVRGSLQFLQHPNGTTHVTGRITGLSPGFHGFHIHAFGDTTNGCNSTGSLFSSSLFIIKLVQFLFHPPFLAKFKGRFTIVNFQD
ncbi:hypothetical protein VIGAN_11129000 [Vigna angularis var. angularis]|uniref:superoxide dismutase n=1 Tax=Vigna angularis var. angularis TaxID=157739 RepID=A0A0S3TA25_PHAAN|nr:hypothetical protein VIGAN_11129000 [Vigna angularis var. angularis]